MSYNHKRSISGVTGNTVNPVIKVNHHVGVVSVKTNSLTPNKQKIVGKDEANKVKPTITRIEMDRTGLIKNLMNGGSTFKPKPSSRPATSGGILGQTSFKSYRDGIKGNHSYDDDNKIKVNRNGSSKSPNTEKKGSKQVSPDNTERVSLMKGTFSSGINGKPLKKDSLLKKFEEMKLGGSSFQPNKSTNKSISVKQESVNISTGTSLKIQPRGTVTFDGPEDFRDNKFQKINNTPGFKEMTTSPLLIRV
jgi:hypothetical protein